MTGPDFIIIGAMKAGTSTLHVQLAQQPGIFMTTPKEPNFFSDDRVYEKGLAWYQALFDAAKAGDLRGESSTHYSKLPTHPLAVSRLYQAFPDVRLVYVVRDPIERLISHYVHAWTENWISNPIEQAIDDYEPLVAYSRYAMQLRPYIETFGPERLKVVFFERMVREPAAVLAEVAAHIGYQGVTQWRDELGRQNESRSRMRRSRLRDAIVRAPLLRQLRRALVPRTVRERIKDLWRMQRRPALSERAQTRLRETFDADLAELGSWFSIDLSCERYRDYSQSTGLVWRSDLAMAAAGIAREVGCD